VSIHVDETRILDADTLTDDAEAADGLPCNVQVIARSEQDEELIAAVEVIAKDLGVV
jgi:Asp-tRNA(Asn)/Glu-tRNA(Gln) amidotransferase A subunit family amidase